MVAVAVTTVMVPAFQGSRGCFSFSDFIRPLRVKCLAWSLSQAGPKGPNVLSFVLWEWGEGCPVPSACCLVPSAHSVLPQNVPADLPRPLPVSPPLCLWLCFLPAVCPAQGIGLCWLLWPWNYSWTWSVCICARITFRTFNNEYSHINQHRGQYINSDILNLFPVVL